MNKRNIIFPSIIFALLSSLFFFGSFSKDYELQKNAEEIAEAAKTTRHKNLLGVKVEAKGSNALPDAEKEYLTLYEAFRLDNYATYAPVANTNKEVDYKIEGIDDAKTLSFFRFNYAESITSGDYFRHKRYPIQFMFEDKPFYDQGYTNVVGISKTQADGLLKAQGKEGPYVLEDYKALTLNSETKSPINLITSNGSKYECYIGNIYFPNSNNVYFAYVNEVIDDFVITYKTLPSDVNKENLYFLNKYSYQNKYFMNHIIKTYSEKSNCKISIVKNNLTSEIDEESLLKFYYGSIGNTNWVSILVTTLVSISMSGITLLSTLKYKLYKSKIYNVLFIISLLLPYILFWIINAISKSTLFFTCFSTTTNLILILSIALIYLISLGVYEVVINRKKGDTNDESKNN